MSDGRWADRDDDRIRLDPRARMPDGRAREERPRPQPGLDRLQGERDVVRYRGRDYHLNEGDVRLMRTVGTFRAIYADHLRDEHASLDYQVRVLRDQGLLDSNRIQLPETRRAVEVLTLTREGHHLVTAAEPGEQRYHWGLVQPRELHHDANLYRLVEHERESLEARGASIERVRTDEELRGDWWSRQYADLDPAERADVVGIAIDDRGHAVFPDIQLEIREPDGSIARCNLELVTAHYSGASMRAKAAAGFRMFRLGGSGARGAGAVHADRELWRSLFEL
jgi:hypothetical protein